MRGISYDWIQKCRKERKMTQQELASRAGISRTYLSNLERGESVNPTWQVVARISKALDKAMPPLLEGELLDSGYQILCRITDAAFTEVFDWLSVLLGYEFETGEVITNIDSFQVVSAGEHFYHGIAVCRVNHNGRKEPTHERQTEPG